MTGVAVGAPAAGVEIRYNVRGRVSWLKVLGVRLAQNGSVHLDCDFVPVAGEPKHRVELRFNKAGWAAALKTGLIEWDRGE
jgi:hypothetical protein